MGICASKDAVKVADAKNGLMRSTKTTSLPESLVNTQGDFVYNKENQLIKCSVDLNVQEFHTKLREQGLFLPQEVCSNRTLKENVTEGGYGILGRSHGTFAKFIEGFIIILSKGPNQSNEPTAVLKPSSQFINIESTEDNDYIYSSVCKGEVENIGVLTHLIMRPLRDEDFPKSRAMKLIAPYSSSKLQNLLQIMAEMSDNEDCSPDFDFRVTVLTNVKNFWYKKSIAKENGDGEPLLIDNVHDGTNKAVITLYMQWANLGGKDQEFGKLEMRWFRSIRKAMGDGCIDASLHDKCKFSHMNHDVACLINQDSSSNEKILDFTTSTSMSELSRYWIYDEARDYVMPHENRTYETAASNMSGNGWPVSMTNSVDKAVSGELENVTAVVQIQVLGGNLSNYTTNSKDEKDNTRIIQSFDCFYDDGSKTSDVWESQAVYGFGFKKLKHQQVQDPKSIEGVISALKRANRDGRAVSYRVNDSIYSVVSSDSHDKLELDLTSTMTELKYEQNDNILKYGIGLSPIELDAKLRKDKLFVPQKSQIFRSHGSFTNYIEGYSLILPKGDKFDQPIAVSVWKPSSNKSIDSNLSKDENDRLYSAIKEGKTEGAGILTHHQIKPLHDEDFPKSRAMKLIAHYSSSKLQNLLQIMAEMTDNDDFPSDFDYSVTIVTDVKNFWYKKSYSKEYGDDQPLSPDKAIDPKPVPVIVLFTQWANIGGKDQEFGKYESGWFRSIRKAMGDGFIDASLHEKSKFSHMNHDVACLLNPGLRSNNEILDFTKPTPMSEITKYWVYDEVREYVMPYDNRTYKTSSTNMSGNGWSEWMTKRVDMVVSGEVTNLKAVFQIKALGGTKLDDNMKGTLLFSVDSFYNRADAKRVDIWKYNNDNEAKSFGFS